MNGESAQNKSTGRRRRNTWLQSIGAAVIAGAIYLSGTLAPLERSLLDFRFGLAQREASKSLVIVEIDQESLKSLDVWPWPRGYHATVLSRLIDAGAIEIALDIDFSSRSVPEMDRNLASALKRARGHVVLPTFRQTVPNASGGFKFLYTAPIPQFGRQVRIASVNVIPDSDGFVRRHATTDFWENGAVPSMVAVLAAPARPSLEIFQIDFGIRPDTIPRISYADVLAGAFDPEMVRGRKVIVGAIDISLGDPFAVPVYQTLPGPVVLALTYESIVQGRALYGSAPWMILAITLIIVLAFGRRFQVWSWRKGILAVAVLGCGYTGLAIAVQYATPLILDTTPWFLATLLVFASSLVSRIDHQNIRLLVSGLRLRSTGELVRNIVEGSADAIFTISRDMLVEVANPAAETIFGVEEGELESRPVETLLPELGDSVEILRGYSGAPACEVQGIRDDGSTVPLELTVSEMRVDGRRQYLVMARDITDRKAQQKLLEYLALHDSLTGLPNRALLFDRLEHSISLAERQGQPLGLLLLDLDRFKEINDTLGHAVGDTLLAEVGQALRDPLRATDTIARLGGDEFAVLLPSVTGPEQAVEIAGRVALALQRPFKVEGFSLDVSVSVGIAMYPEHGTDANQLMRSADVAMYMAKGNKEGCAMYDASADSNSIRSLAMGSELRRAMEDGQLVVNYQPQIDITLRRLVGAEALVRWQHPRYGLIPPDEFINLAEQTGLIRQLTRWMVGKSVRQMALWKKEELEIGMSLNLSARNLSEEDLAETISKVLKNHEIEAQLLTLEITESAIMGNPDRVLESIRQLSEIGVRLAIDDFGSGYSSLAYLKNLPVDELKIDKSFVINMVEDSDDAIIVRSTIDLAHNLGLFVVAEGVEGEPHLRVLETFGCDVAQGYHIARPMAANQFMDWVQTHTTHVAEDGGAPAGRYLARRPHVVEVEAPKKTGTKIR